MTQGIVRYRVTDLNRSTGLESALVGILSYDQIPCFLPRKLANIGKVGKPRPAFGVTRSAVTTKATKKEMSLPVSRPNRLRGAFDLSLL